MGHWYDEDIPIVAAKRRGVLPQKEKVTKHERSSDTLTPPHTAPPGAVFTSVPRTT